MAWISTLKGARVLDVLMTICTFSGQADMVGANTYSSFQSLDEIPHRS